MLKFSAGGFRDFTRIAASDPTMWRDIFLANKDAVLEMLGRFSEDLSALTRAMRRGDGQTLFDHFHADARDPPRHRRHRPGFAVPDFGRPHPTLPVEPLPRPMRPTTSSRRQCAARIRLTSSRPLSSARRKQCRREHKNFAVAGFPALYDRGTAVPFLS